MVDPVVNRGAKKTRKAKDGFAFSGLITCGHCGCAMVGQIKKGGIFTTTAPASREDARSRTRARKCWRKKFASLLKGIAFSDETLAWVRQALRESHRDERQFHEDAIAKLQREHQRLQGRIDSMYEDKLDGRIGNDFFDTKATEIRTEQARIMRDLEAHQTANRSYIEEGVQLLELAHRAPVLFESQPPAEKRKLLNFVLSNCTWKGGELSAKYRQPFDVLEVAVASERQRIGEGSAENGQFENWLPICDSNSPQFRPRSYAAQPAPASHTGRTDRTPGKLSPWLSKPQSRTSDPSPSGNEPAAPWRAGCLAPSGPRCCPILCTSKAATDRG